MPDLTSTSTSNTQMPSWLTDYLKQLAGSAATTASQGYQTYTGPRIAALTPDQLKAQQLTEQNTGAYQPYFDSADQAFQNADSGGLNSQSFNSFMNPYQSQVVNQIATLGNRNLTENVLPSVNSTFTGAGQFGSSRNADFTHRALRDNQEAISQAQGQALNSGFQNQVQNSQNALQQGLQSGQLQQGLGLAEQGSNLTDASALSTVGQQQQNQTQQNYNLGYQDFLSQQQWPYQQESYLSGILSGTPTNTSTTQTNTTPGPSTTGQILGGLAGGIGLIGSTGGFGSGGWLGDLGSTVSSFFAEGGKVKSDDDENSDITARELRDWWMRFRKTQGYQTPTPPDDGTFAPLEFAKGGRAKRPRFGGIATKRMGGIGMQPGGGVSGILPGAPAAAAQRLPSNLSPGTASILRGLSGGASPRARMV